jgi:uncharacterized coiled-coil protein SlyX
MTDRDEAVVVAKQLRERIARRLPIDGLAVAELLDALSRQLAEAQGEVERQREALNSLAGFGDVNLAGEYESGLRDIIRSMTDCAKRALLSREKPEHAAALEREYDPDVAPCDDAEFGMKP